jgi:hypothetical protein
MVGPSVDGDGPGIASERDNEREGYKLSAISAMTSAI